MAVTEVRSGPQVKRLKDYPLNEWQDAADDCEYCGAPYQARVTYVDKSGNFGSVEFRAHHKAECMRDLGERQVESERVGLSESDVAGWEFAENAKFLFGKEWTPLKVRANVGPCLNCWRLIVGVPIILFIDQGRGGEIDLCFKCAADLGVLNALAGGRK